jgi:hypothetical protein
MNWSAGHRIGDDRSVVAVAGRAAGAGRGCLPDGAGIQRGCMRKNVRPTWSTIAHVSSPTRKLPSPDRNADALHPLTASANPVS